MTSVVDLGDLERREGLRCGFLLGGLLRRAPPLPERLAVDQGGADEPALVRRPVDREHLVLDDAAGPRQRFLKLCLRVDVPSACESDYK